MMYPSRLALVSVVATLLLGGCQTSTSEPPQDWTGSFEATNAPLTREVCEGLPDSTTGRVSQLIVSLETESGKTFVELHHPLDLESCRVEVTVNGSMGTFGGVNCAWDKYRIEDGWLELDYTELSGGYTVRLNDVDCPRSGIISMTYEFDARRTSYGSEL